MTFNTILITCWVITIIIAIYRYFFVGLPAWTQPSRASAENKPLASWKYTGEEWACYSDACFFKDLKDESLRNSRKEVKIDITSKYIVLTSGALSERFVIDGKCVRTVDCTISGNVLNIVRGVRFPSRFGSGRDKFQKRVFQLPIPRGDDEEARVAGVVEYFGSLIQEEAENIADIYAAQG